MTEVLRAGVLEGVRATIAPLAPSNFFAPLHDRLVALGATVAPPASSASSAAPTPPASVIVVECSGESEPRAALDGAWDVIRPAAEAMIAAGDGGQILLLAPPPGDPHAEAARAGLENLARTLSVEWARYAIRPVTLLPGTTTSPAEVAELVAFLASPAGAYYAGCAFTLGSAAATA